MSISPLIIIVGPTAGGKSDLAVRLARHLPGGGECISADSMQVYRELNIGTAKPTLDEQQGVPHHLIDLVEPDDETFSVDRWLELAETCIADIRSRGKQPIVVGGTNLYVQALLYGLFQGPPPDPERRRALAARSTAELRSRLQAVDPESATRIHANDLRRTIRAIEVFEATGIPLSNWQRQWTAPPRPDARLIGLDWPVPDINRRINARVRGMMHAGLLEEVRRLHDAGRLGSRAREALGYRQLIDHLEGRCSVSDAVEQVAILTRRYAKQQRTWLRRLASLPQSIFFPAGNLAPELVSHKALEYLARPPAEGGGKALS